VQVGVTDAAGLDSDQDFALTRSGVGNVFDG